jgi:acetyl-CoA C-acetyltransferase
MDVFVVGAARTPIGSFQGALSKVAAPQLMATAIRGALRGLDASLIEQAYVGNVLSSGLGQAPSRQAVIHAGLPERVTATTVGKVCGSGLEAAILATRALKLGDAALAIAGGMESMSNAPYLLAKARGGYRMGHGALIDAMIKDGLWDAYEDFHMGSAGDRAAQQLGFTRREQDQFARESYERAREAIASGAFKDEIVAVDGVDTDEEPGRVELDRMGALKPVFLSDGTITPANASKISDGAAALALANEDAVAKHGLQPLARVVSYAGHAQGKSDFATAPTHATQRALARAQLSVREIDLFEINEAFAAVALIVARQLDVARERVNVRGGAVALGHPLGASGARIVVTLLHALRAHDLKRGVATVCLGGGEALAMVLERV